MIRVYLGSWEGLMGQLGKVELLTWTQPTLIPAPRGLESQPQAREVSRGVRGIGSEGGLDDQSLFGELGGPDGPAG